MFIRTCIILILLHVVPFAGAAAADVPHASLRATDGAILVDGVPFFPFGLYEESNRISAATAISYLRDMANGGLNCVHMKETPDFGSVLDEADRLGMKIIVEAGYDTILSGPTISDFRNKPAVIAWNFSDDADNGNVSTAELRRRYDAVKAADPTRLAFFSLTGYYANRRSRAAEFLALTDSAGFQSYPISPLPDFEVQPDLALSDHYLRCRQYVDAAASLTPKRNLIVTTQTFSWALVSSDPHRVPTPAEERNMTYAAYAAGAKGIVGFTYLGLPDEVDLWNEVKALAREASVLAPVLLDGAINRVDTGDGHLVASTWRTANQVTVVVINTSYSLSKSVNITLPDGARNLTSVFTGRPSGLALNGLRLAGNVAPLDVHVYRADLSAGNQAPTVSLSAPASGTVGSAVSLSASASDSDGSVASVSFYVGSTLLSTDTSAPFAASWTPSAAGSYQVTAVATDNLGASATSSASTVTIAAGGGGVIGTGTGLLGSYFANLGFTGTPVTRTDATINFDWGGGSPISGVGVDGFTVRWAGQVQAQFSETYTFTTVSDDGVRLWVNGQQLISNWTDHAPTTNSGTITLSAGSAYDIVLEYYENGGGAVAQLLWSSASTAQQIIPTTQLYPATSSGLPAGWTAQDVGTVGLSGSTSVSNGTWTVTGSGADIWNSADGFHYAYQQISGDVQITARVTGQSNTDGWAKAGVMIRSSTASGAAHAFSCVTPGSGVAFQRRSPTSAVSLHSAGPNAVAPYWVRVTRIGDVLIGWSSADGSSWSEIGRETISMGSSVLVGLAVTSHNDAQRSTATFSDVQVTTSGVTPGGGLPAGWTSQDVGTVGAGGSAQESLGTWTVAGSGADIWNSADGFRFAYRQMSGDVRITARVTGLENTNAWAKAGVMLRSALTAGSPHGSTFATSANGVAYQRRLTTHATSGHTAGPFLSAPVWVRLERVGSTLTSSTSTDGSTWTVIRSETVNLGATVSVGLAVTSHADGRVCTATFTNVEVIGAAAAAN